MLREIDQWVIKNKRNDELILIIYFYRTKSSWNKNGLIDKFIINQIIYGIIFCFNLYSDMIEFKECNA